MTAAKRPRGADRTCWVMRNGRLYDTDTLDERRPRERRLGTPVWLGHDPDGVPRASGSDPPAAATTSPE